MVPGWCPAQVIHTATGRSSSDTAPEVMLLGVGGWGGSVSSLGSRDSVPFIPSQHVLFSFYLLLTCGLKLQAPEARSETTRRQVGKHPAANWKPQEAGREPR